MKTQTIIALRFLAAMTVLTGIIYPLIMTGMAQVIFPLKANGSLIKIDGQITGSELIGQKFDSIIYFWSRPSSNDYNPVPSSGSNYGPTSDMLKKQVAARRILFAEINSVQDASRIPEEMIFASGSGLDPHISPVAALLQADRIIKARHFDKHQEEKLLAGIKNMTEPPQFLILGEKRINVLKLNIKLNSIEENSSNNK
jgi:potassium-transporting ATPase KdpC subunit